MRLLFLQTPIIATILALTENGLNPVLVEPGLNTLEINDDFIEDLITPCSKTIYLVH
jgi:dTDP-4-amino-4,6-dideoxygalactose transaminase